MSLIRLEEVWKFYGKVEAVSKLNLRCEDGEMLALLGPSGCGKSTTLKMIAGVEPVTKGEIFFGDRAVSSLQPGERNIAMVFEDYALYPHMSVFENIAFPLKVRGLPAHTVNAKVKKIVDLLGLEELSRTNVRSLSGGAQQRVSIGRALVRNPQLLINVFTGIKRCFHSFLLGKYVYIHKHRRGQRSKIFSSHARKLQCPFNQSVRYRQIGYGLIDKVSTFLLFQDQVHTRYHLYQSAGFLL